MTGAASGTDTLVDELLDGDHRALARTITVIEDRTPGYRDLVSSLHEHAGETHVVGVTGSPGAGKSTLVDKLARAYRERGDTVGVIAVDPASPYSGGAVLGDRIRMASNAGDMEVFFRSMSTRGALGGLSTATTDAITALSAFGKDVVIIETVGAGQNEVDVVRTADTVAVLVQPGSGDDVQMLKAGILEIGDVFVVNKADVEGASRTVSQLKEMLRMRDGGAPSPPTGHHGASARSTEDTDVTTEGDADASDEESWDPPVLETVATAGDGVDEVLDAFDAHRAHLDASGERAGRARDRQAAAIRRLLRDDAGALLERELDRHGGIDALVDAVLDRETDRYTVADEIIGPLEDCLEPRREQ